MENENARQIEAAEVDELIAEHGVIASSATLRGLTLYLGDGTTTIHALPNPLFDTQMIYYVEEETA